MFNFYPQKSYVQFFVLTICIMFLLKVVILITKYSLQQENQLHIWRFDTSIQHLWPMVNILWSEFWDKNNSNFNFWQMAVSQYAILCPFLCEKIRILLASALTMKLLACSYSELAKIYYKDRNKILVKNLETLYLLSSLKSYYNELSHK